MRDDDIACKRRCIERTIRMKGYVTSPLNARSPGYVLFHPARVKAAWEPAVVPFYAARVSDLGSSDLCRMPLRAHGASNGSDVDHCCRRTRREGSGLR